MGRARLPPAVWPPGKSHARRLHALPHAAGVPRWGCPPPSLCCITFDPPPLCALPSVPPAAQSWSQYLTQPGLDCGKDRKTKLGDNPRGQNVAVLNTHSASSTACAFAAQLWYSQVTGYSFTNPQFLNDDLADFTQVRPPAGALAGASHRRGRAGAVGVA